MEYISDKIGEDYKKWEDVKEAINGFEIHYVFITAPTGSGKTTFILKTLYKYAIENERKIVYFVNRRILKKQIESELMEIQIEWKVENLYKKNNFFKNSNYQIEDYIKIMTYQELEEKPDFLFLNGMYYLVADECHYFFNDSTFNPKTIISFRKIMLSRINCKIFMSATMDRIEKYIDNLANAILLSQQHCINEKLIHHESNYVECSKDYSYVNLKYFCKDEEIKELVESSGKEKWLIFLNNKNKGKNLNKYLNGKKIKSVFIDAGYSYNEDSLMAVNEIAAENQTKEAQVVIATSVLDNGVSFVDDDLKNMVIIADTEEEFIQMLGRKRVRGDNPNDRLNLYIEKKDKDYFKRRRDELLKQAEFLNNLNETYQKRYAGYNSIPNSTECFIDYICNALFGNVTNGTKEDNFYQKIFEYVQSNFCNSNPPNPIAEALLLQLNRTELQTQLNYIHEKYGYEKAISFLFYIYNLIAYGFSSLEKLLYFLYGREEWQADYLLEQCLQKREFYDQIKKICYINKHGNAFINCFSEHQIYYLHNHYKDIVERFEKEGDGNSFLRVQAEWMGFGEEEIDNLIQESTDERYNKLHEEVEDCIESYFETEEGETKGCVLNEERNKKLKGEIQEPLREMLSMKVDTKNGSWRATYNSLGQKDRTISKDMFNKVMKELDFPYSMEKESKNFIIKRIEKK